MEEKRNLDVIASYLLVKMFCFTCGIQ